MITNSLTQKVLVAGATGLVGSALLEILTNEITVQEIIVVGRTEPALKSSKIKFSRSLCFRIIWRKRTASSGLSLAPSSSAST